MKLKNLYVSYISSLKPEFCEKVISLGLSKMKDNKNKGISTSAIVRSDKQINNDKQDKNENLKSLTSSDKTIEEIKKDNNELEKLYFRNSEVCWLNNKWIFESLIPIMADANKKAGWNWQIDSAEQSQFTVYHGTEDNSGFYGWHSDGFSDQAGAYKPALKISENPLRFKQPKRNKENKIILDNKGNPEVDMGTEDIPLNKDRSGLNPSFSEDIKKWGKVRKISMTVNLTDPKNYKGGNLKFDLGPHIKQDRFKVCDDIRPQGSAVVFPSFTYHCVTPVTSGTRYSLVIWFLGKPWQ